ncbi:proline-rich protein 36-like [Penaeus monodon]|uniref:proline-rich protein 36-like n=1 Tax=Penaeus monodon TaxID=6687 RepID=UPI0018A6EB56|nr:proline-rich protein 36-like [Penaeus monodon]
MNRPRSSLLSAASLFSVLVSTSTAFIETAREESLVIRPKKQILFANAFEETPAERIPDVPDEVFQREEILEQDHDASKESGRAVYEPAEHAHKKSGLPTRFRVRRDDLSSPAADTPGSSVRRQQGILTWLYQVPGYQHSLHLSSIPLPSTQISVPYVSVSGNSDIRTGTPYIPPPGYPILVQDPFGYLALHPYPQFPQGHRQHHHEEVICKSEELEESITSDTGRSSVSFPSSSTLSSSPVLPAAAASPPSLVTPTSLLRSVLSPSVPASSSTPSSVSSLSFSPPSPDSSSSFSHPPSSDSTSPLSSPSPSLPTSLTPTNSSSSSLSHPTQDDEIRFVFPVDKFVSADNIIFPSSTDRPIIFPTHSPASVTQPSPTSVPTNNITVPANETDIRVSIVAPSRPCTRPCEYAAAEGVCLTDYSCLTRHNALRIGNSTQRSTEKP